MRILRAMLLMLALLVVPQLASAQTFPPLSGRVVDAANLLSPAQKQQLEALSADVGKVAQRQFVVATIPDLQGYPVEDYGYKLGRAWGIGQKDANNGIILIVAPNERKVRIEVGYGLEPIMTDALAQTIIDDQILPKFRAGDMAGGIMAGAQAVAEQMKAPPEAAEARVKAAAAEPQAARSSGSSSDGFIAIFWIVIILFFVLPIVFRGARGRKYRGGRGPVVLWGPGLGGGWGSGGGSSCRMGPTECRRVWCRRSRCGRRPAHGGSCPVSTSTPSRASASAHPSPSSSPSATPCAPSASSSVRSPSATSHHLHDSSRMQRGVSASSGTSRGWAGCPRRGARRSRRGPRTGAPPRRRTRSSRGPARGRSRTRPRGPRRAGGCA